MPVKETLNLSSEHLGFSQKTIIELFVLKELEENGPSHPSPIYPKMIESLPGINKSKPYLYKTMDEMKGRGDLQVNEDTYRKIYAITSEGLKVRQQAYSAYFEKLMSVKQLAQVFLYRLTGLGNPVQNEESIISVSHQKFFNRLINVRKLFRYLFLINLQKGSLTVSDFKDYIDDNFRWRISSGYLYDLAHQLKEDGLVKSKWEDDERRNKKYYHITPDGIDHISLEADEAIYPIRQLLQLTQLILSLLEGRK